MKSIKEIQDILKKENIDGWLIYSFQHSNNLAINLLKLQEKHITRRFYYWIPIEGNPVKIVHGVESNILDAWEGDTIEYYSWESLNKAIISTLKGKKKIAMEYSKNCAIPYVSKVDGGTIEFIRNENIEVVSSSSFLAYFTSVLTKEQIKQHMQAANLLDETAKNIWQLISTYLKENKKISEYDVQQKILEAFEKNNFITDSWPICAVNEHAADPHFSVPKENSTIIKKGDIILIDLWCKKNVKNSIYGDITRMAVADIKPNEKQKKIFSIVRQAQKNATDFISSSLSQNKQVQGWEVDQVCREYIKKEGYEKYFIHRTGHNIDTELHGSGAGLDNLESHDVRVLLKNTCFSIEPGIYLPGEFGVRLEHDAYIDDENKLILTGGIQNEIMCLL